MSKEIPKWAQEHFYTFSLTEKNAMTYEYAQLYNLQKVLMTSCNLN